MRDIMPFFSSNLIDLIHEVDLLRQDRPDLTRVIIMDDATGGFLRADFYHKNEIGVDALYKTLYPQVNRFVVAVRHILHDNGNITLFVAPGAVEIENGPQASDDNFQPLHPPGPPSPE